MICPSLILIQVKSRWGNLKNLTSISNLHLWDEDPCFLVPSPSWRWQGYYRCPPRPTICWCIPSESPCPGITWGRRGLACTGPPSVAGQRCELDRYPRWPDTSWLVGHIYVKQPAEWLLLWNIPQKQLSRKLDSRNRERNNVSIITIIGSIIWIPNPE